MWKREIQRRSKRAQERRQCYPWKLSSPLVILRHPACVLSIPVTLFMALWLRDPRVGCHFAARPCHSPPGSARGSTPEGQVASAELEPRTVVVRQSRSCDGPNVTVEPLTFGPGDDRQEPASAAPAHARVFNATKNPTT